MNTDQKCAIDLDAYFARIGHCGGTTPTLGFVRHCAEAAPGLAIRVLVRARPGDFVHSPQEVEVMAVDIEATRAALGDSARLGFVIGTLEPDCTIAVDAVRRLVAACADAPVTFHKAFDSVPDQAAGLALLADLGVTRVLTSGAGENESPTFSPDGRRIAFTSRRGGKKQIWVMEIDGSNPRPLTSEGNNDMPDWSRAAAEK